MNTFLHGLGAALLLLACFVVLYLDLVLLAGVLDVLPGGGR